MCQDSVEAISQINQCDQDYSLRMSPFFHHGLIGIFFAGKFFSSKGFGTHCPSEHEQ